MSNFHGRSAHELAMASALLVARLGELLLTKGLVSPDQMKAVVQAAEGNALSNRTTTTSGAISVILEIGCRWESIAATL